MRARSTVGAALGVAIAAAGVAVPAHGDASDGSGPPVRPRPSAARTAERRALALWSTFPVGARHRPVVVPVDMGIVNEPDDAREDIAMYDSTWTLAPPPSADLTVARDHRWITAANAFRALRRDRDPRPEPGHRLAVGARLGRATFVTDRGLRPLPAWRFAFGHFAQPATVIAAPPYPAPALRRLLRDGVSNSQAGEQARASDGGRALRIAFVGGPPGDQPCDDGYSATISQSAHAVAFTVYEHPAPDPTGVACTLVGHTRTVDVHLDHPLGNRPLVNSTDGAAIPAARAWTYPGPSRGSEAAGGR